MTEIWHRFVKANGTRIHITEAGSGPLVVLLHGFPEFWYSWRHQLIALAEAGFHAVAPDQRGYGQTDRPEEISGYTILRLVGDVVGLLDALGEDQAVVAGHDWGAAVAWQVALMRPDRLRGVIAVSIPYRPRGSNPPIPAMRALFGEGFYQAYFQTPGVPDSELARDVAATFRRFLYAASADGLPMEVVVAPGGGLLDLWPEPDQLPAWLTQDVLDTYTEAFTASGFTGGLNWYRNIDRNWELTAPWHHVPVTTPALFIAGDMEVEAFPAIDKAVEDLPNVVPNLARTVLVPDSGHWVQQEQPAVVNQAMIEFLH